MKPKLLITLGCSYTSGIGTSDPYHHMWPRQLGIKLGFDKLINLGKAGASNSGCIKKFNEMVNNFPLNEYDILVIFLMTEPSRFSFFIDNEVMDYRANIPKWKNPINDNTLSRAYLEEIKSLQDCILEQKFYVDILESMCKLHNMDLILTSWNYSYTDFYKIHKNKNIHLFKTPKTLFPTNKDLQSECGHPNDKGQVWVMNEIVKGIKQNNSKWYSETPNENLDWEVKNKIEDWQSTHFI
jgi:hypothetical protein